MRLLRCLVVVGVVALLTFAQAARAPRVFVQLTGLTLVAFTDLLPAFERAAAAAVPTTGRQRRPGAGRKSVLTTAADKLFFWLFSFRHYPTQETLAFLFGFSPGQANHWIHRRTPLVNQALGYELHRPARTAADLHTLMTDCPGLEFSIAGTDRPTRRSHQPAQQKAD